MSEKLKIALLTMKDQTQEAINGEKPLVYALKEEGFQVEWVIWSEETDWNKFDLAIVRTTWDYQDHFEHFVTQLEKIEESSCILFNSLDCIRWNIDKHYLFELQKSGVSIVPTKSYENLDFAFSSFDCKEVVVKPTISASAYDTFLIHKDEVHDYKERLSELAKKKTMIVQPKIEAITTEGEYSLHYFGGEFSHAVLKKPKSGDFRSQEEYGSYIKAVDVDEALTEMSEEILNLIEFERELLFARVDLVRTDDGFALMELELIEPCLYLTFDDRASDRLVEKIKDLAKSEGLLNTL